MGIDIGVEAGYHSQMEDDSVEFSLSLELSVAIFHLNIGGGGGGQETCGLGGRKLNTVPSMIAKNLRSIINL